MPETTHSPKGRTAAGAAKSRAEGNPEYRAARDEYDRIRELRKVNPIAAHLRERRFELELTQEQVAQAVQTSHTNISRMERGTFMPKLPTLQRIAAVLDEELLVCFERVVDGEVEREFASIGILELRPADSTLFAEAHENPPAPSDNVRRAAIRAAR